MVEGHGGTRKVVDGMDVWTHGDPPRRFQVLGIIEDERPGGVIPMAQLEHDIVQKTRQNGGNVVILVSSASHSSRVTTHASSASAYGMAIRPRLSDHQRRFHSPDAGQPTPQFDISID